MSPKRLPSLFVAAFFAVLPLSAGAETLREEQTVTTARGQEVWRLVFAEAPTPACGADDVEMSLTCPCSGFAYGEQGQLALVRLVGGREIERLDLTPLFDDAETPEGAVAIVQRRPARDGDLERFYADDPKLAKEIAQRPVTHVMKLADYDRDGRAEEFLLQVGTLPCAKHQYVAVGLPRGEDRLRPLSASGDEAPLVLPLEAWTALRDGKAPTTVETLACGDHGSEARDDLEVFAHDGEITVAGHSFPCTGQ